MSYKTEKITIEVEPGESRGSMYHKMMEAALDHKCAVYAVHNGVMFSISYDGMLSQMEQED